MTTTNPIDDGPETHRDDVSGLTELLDGVETADDDDVTRTYDRPSLHDGHGDKLADGVAPPSGTDVHLGPRGGSTKRYHIDRTCQHVKPHFRTQDVACFPHHEPCRRCCTGDYK